MKTQSWQSKLRPIALPLVLLFSAVLLLWDLGSRALWWDEIVNVMIVRTGAYGILVNLLAVPGAKPTVPIDIHPPLFHFIEYFWTSIAGMSDLAVRIPNVLFAFIALFLLYHIAQKIDDATTGILAVLLAGMSPFWLLYARMARYYALTAALALASTLLFILLLQRPTRVRWLGYFLVGVAMLYADYLIATVFLCQALYMIWARPGRRWFLTWVGVMAVVGLAYLPWLPAWRAQATDVAVMEGADLAFSLVGTLLKFAFPLSSFTVGETVFPWELPAILGYLVFTALLVVGILRLARQPSTQEWPGRRLPFILLFTIIPTIGTIALITFVTPTITFIGIANRTFFAFPFVMLLVVIGIRSIRPIVIRSAITLVLVALLIYPVTNYYAGRHFVNPIYAVPTKEALADVLAIAQPGDVIFSDFDTGFAYYFEQQPHNGLTQYDILSDEGQAALQRLGRSVQAHSSPEHPRLFMLIYGRDRTRRDLPQAFTEEIQPSAHLVWERGYIPEDETYRSIKQRLLGREDYNYKLLIQLYELPG